MQWGLLNVLGGIRGTVVALDCWSTGRAIDPAPGIHNKIHLIIPGCPRPSIALQEQNRGLKHQSFIRCEEHIIFNIKSIYIIALPIRRHMWTTCYKYLATRDSPYSHLHL